MNEQLHHIDTLLDSHDVKKAEVAIAKLLRADASTETRTLLLLRRARARLIGHRPDDALEDIQTARTLQGGEPDSPDTLALLGDIYFGRFELSPVGFTERSDANKALKLYDQIIETAADYDNIGWIYYQKARVLLTADRTDEAIACLQEALLQPSQVTALTAFCYERLGFIHLFERRDPSAATSFLDRAAVTYPPSEPESWLGQLHILRSRALREQGEYTEALEAAEKALQVMEKLGNEMRGGQQDAHLAVSEILVQFPGREAEAAEHLQHFLQLGKKPLGVDVTWSRVNELLGDMLFRIERYEAAIDAYNNALAFNPYHPWETTIYYQIARCYYHLRAYEKTISTTELIIQAVAADNEDLSDYRVYHLLGNAHFALEAFQSAVEAYQKAVDLAPPQANDRDKIQTYLRFAQELTLKTS